MNPTPNAGKYLQFDFYVDKADQSPITPNEAYSLQHELIGWIRERGFGFDGFTRLGNVFKDGKLQKVGEETTE